MNPYYETPSSPDTSRDEEFASKAPASNDSQNIPVLISRESDSDSSDSDTSASLPSPITSKATLFSLSFSPDASSLVRDSHRSYRPPESTYPSYSSDTKLSTGIPDLTHLYHTCHNVNEILRGSPELRLELPDYCSLETVLVSQILAVVKIATIHVRKYNCTHPDLVALADFADKIEKEKYLLPAPIYYYIENLGYAMPDPAYGEVVPALPDISKMFTILDEVSHFPNGILRIGLIPLMIQMYRNICYTENLYQSPALGAVQLYPIMPASDIIGLSLDGIIFSVIKDLGHFGHPWTLARHPRQLKELMRKHSIFRPLIPNMTDVSFDSWTSYCGFESISGNQWFSYLLGRCSIVASIFNQKSIVSPTSSLGFSRLLIKPGILKDHRTPGAVYTVRYPKIVTYASENASLDDEVAPPREQLSLAIEDDLGFYPFRKSYTALLDCMAAGPFFLAYSKNWPKIIDPAQDDPSKIPWSITPNVSSPALKEIVTIISK